MPIYYRKVCCVHLLSMIPLESTPSNRYFPFNHLDRNFLFLLLLICLVQRSVSKRILITVTKKTKVIKESHETRQTILITVLSKSQRKLYVGDYEFCSNYRLLNSVTILFIVIVIERTRSHSRTSY